MWPFRQLIKIAQCDEDCSRRRGRRAMPRTLRCESLEFRRLLAAEGTVHTVNGTFDAAGLVGEVSATVSWGDGTTSPASSSAVNAASGPKIRIDYSLDTGGFFSGANQSRRSLLQFAADSLVSRFSDDLAAISPGGYNQWMPSVFHPSQGPSGQLAGTITPLSENLAVPANEIIIYAGARDLPGASRGVGGPGSYQFPAQQITCPTQAECDRILAEIEAFKDVVRGRGEPGALASPQTDVAPQVGSVSFDTGTDWHFGTTPDNIQPGQVDFLSVAIHEIAHVLGFGITNTNAITSWANLTSSGAFSGPKARAAYVGNGNVPVAGNHWAASVLDSNGQATLMAAQIQTGTQQLFSTLDFAAMDDLGWDLVGTSTTVTAEHRYPDDGNYPVEVILKGSSAGELTYPVSEVAVTNVAPTLNVAPTQSVVAGQSLSVTNIGEITDPGFANASSDPPTSETFTYTINWGDGSDDTTGTATIDQQGTSAGGLTMASFDGSHLYETTGSKTVTVSVADDDGGTAQQTLIVNVSAPPALTLELDKSTIAEDDGDGAATLTIRRSGPATGSNQTINLASNDPSEATVPGSVVIPGDATSVTVAVRAIDDALKDGDVTVELSASAAGLDPDTIELIVADHESLTAAFSATEVREDATSPVNLVVGRSNTDGDQELTISISGGDAVELNVPTTITIPANQQQISVAISPVNDEDPEWRRTLSYTFTSADYETATAEIDLIDDEPPLFQNPASQYDVDNSGGASAGDALRVINQMSIRGGSALLDPESEQPSGVYYDVNGDYRISALDALVIINELARQLNSQSSQLEFVPANIADPSFALANALQDDDEDQLTWQIQTQLS